MLAHKDAPFAMRVAKKLTSSNCNHVFIHVDAKSDISPFLPLDGMSNGRIHLLNTRTFFFNLVFHVSMMENGG